MINIDSFLKKGKQHFICEDYIIHGECPIPYIILSDGCSSSENTDIGSRILCRCALNVLNEKLNFRFPDAELNNPNYWNFGRRIIEKAKDVMDLLKLKKTVLDATLIISYIWNDIVWVLMFGDGLVTYKFSSSSFIHYKEIKFDINAPYYLNYLIDKDRDLAYYQNQNKEFITISESSYMDDKLINKSKKYDHSNSDIFIYGYPIDSLEFLAISSDGIDSFIDNKGNSLDYKESIIKDFTSFKNTNGKFVKRRLSKAISEYEKFNFKHLDDISFGCFYFSEDK